MVAARRPCRLLASLPLLVALWTSTVLTHAVRAQGTYTNPVVMEAGALNPVQNCADPTVIHGQLAGDTNWYLYCTQDALGDNDHDASGAWRAHRVPTFRSTDLTHWTYVDDAFAGTPSWADPGAAVWAPEIVFANGRYFLYYAVTSARALYSGQANCGEDSAIGVATSSSPTGPWADLGKPVVAPRRHGAGCDFEATIDPEVVTASDGSRFIYYGSYKGGLEVRTLSADGFTAPAASAVRVAVSDRYEGALVVPHGGFWYLLASSANCCNGPLTGYDVAAGRATSPTGPFLDREGVPLAAGRAGGTPVLSSNGARWIGPGHPTHLTDFAGQDWLLYHAVDRDDPYFANSPGYTKRALLLDALDWTLDWPAVRAGWGSTETLQPAPAAQPGETVRHTPCVRIADAPGAPVPEASDEFDGSVLNARWSWIRPPSAAHFSVGGGVFRFDTQDADLYGTMNDASVLVEDAPPGDFVVDVRVRLDVPADGCCYDYVQAGLVLYHDDDNFVKLVHASIGASRQTEFAKEESPVPAGYPFYGGGPAGAPDTWTVLRVAKRASGSGARYTAWTSRDGVTWTRGATWFHRLAPGEKIGLVAMSRAGFTAQFDFVHAARLAPAADPDAFDATLVDSDGDGLGDACTMDDDADGLPDADDCAPTDGQAGRPDTVPRLETSGGAATRLSWTRPARADRFDLARGLLSALAPGAYGACAANDLDALTWTDPELPAAGNGFTYLVRAVDLGCGGAGSWGTTSSGAERIDASPGACP